MPDETGSVEVTSPTGETVQVPIGRGQTSVEIRSYRVGTNTTTPVTVTPFSRFELPPGLGGSSSGAAVTIAANGVGAPRDVRLVLTSVSNGDDTSTVTARASAQSGGDGSTLRYGIVGEGQPCVTGTGGSEATFPGLPDGQEYRFTVCVESWYDGEVFGRGEATESVRAQQSGRAPRSWTFAVDPTPNVSSSRAEWIIRSEPTTTDRIPNHNHPEFAGWGPGTTVFDRDPGIQVRYVHDWWFDVSPWANVTARSGSAPYQVQARWWVERCVGGSALVARGDSSNDTSGGKAAIAFANAQLRYYDEDGAVIAHTADTWEVPVGAVRVDGISVSVDWAAQGWGLSAASTTFSSTCDPNNPGPPPDPEPTPPPTQP